MPDFRVLHLATYEFDCLFETDTGFLRKIRRGETEIVRAIYAAVRDENWNTVEPSIDVRNVHVEPNGFRVEFDARCQAADICFCWSGSIEAHGPKLTFTFKGEARSKFRKNRIGFCVLHPIRECAALPCSIQDTRGKWSEAFFPEYISPHQPFKDLRGLRWSPRPGVKAELIFQGDIFETEDQRNWTDASFKTYCTPLAHPFPVLIEVGTKVDQEVTLDLESEEPVHLAESKVPEIDLGKFEVEVPMPGLGLGMASHGHRLSQLQLQRLKKLRLNHLRVDLRLAGDAWVNEYRLAVEEAEAIGARLQAALFVSDNAFQELGQFRHLMEPALVDSCLIFHEKEISTSEHWLSIAQEVLDGVQIVAGTNAYFTELNRHRPPRGFPAAYSINPQVHAFDDRSLMENLEAQPATVESARQFCEHGLVLSPITLRPRFNANATSKTMEPEGQLPSTVDRRQRTMVGACWMAGSLAALLPCEGVASLTYFETTGWRGLMETEQGSALSAQFDSSPNEIFPSYHVLKFVAGASSVVRLSDPLLDGVSVLGLRDRNASTRYLLANLEAVSKRIRCRAAAKAIELRVLSETNLETLRKGNLPEAKLLFPSGQALDFDFPGMSLALIRLEA